MNSRLLIFLCSWSPQAIRKSGSLSPCPEELAMYLCSLGLKAEGVVRAGTDSDE